MPFADVTAGSLGPSTWLPWLGAMVASLLIYAANGLYQVGWPAHGGLGTEQVTGSIIMLYHE